MKRCCWIFALLLALAVAACSQSAAPSPAPAPTQASAPASKPAQPPQAAPTAVPKPSGEFKIAFQDMATQAIDPVLGSAPVKMYLSLVFDYLVGAGVDSKTDAKLGIAEKWEVDHGAETSTYTFHLRKGVKFHNGDDLTAEDVKFSIERLTSNRALSSYAKPVGAAIRDIEVVDPSTVRIRTKKPYIWLVEDLSPITGIEGMVLPKKYIEEKGEKNFAVNPIGSGPYRFAKQEMGSYIVLEALDNHWRLGVPVYKNIRFMLVPEETTRLALLKRGDADAVAISMSSVKDLKAAGFNIFGKPGVLINGFPTVSAFRPESPLSKEKVRLALNLAINRKEIQEQIFYGTGKIVGHWAISSWSVGGIETPLYPYDPEKAKQLIVEAGYPQGFDIDLESYALRLPEYKDVNAAVASAWQKVGARTKIVPIDFAAWREKVVKRTSPVNGISGVQPLQGRPLTQPILYSVMHSKGELHMYESPEIDALIEAPAAAKTVEEYAKRIGDIARYQNEHSIFIPLQESDENFAAQKKITDWKLGYRLSDYSLDYLTTRR